MKFFNGIFKWLLVLALSLSAGLLAIILLANYPQVNSFLLRIIFLLAIGFIGGLFTRIFFRKGFALVLILFGLITSILAVFVFDLFYEKEYIFTFLPQNLDSLSNANYGFQIPSIQDAAQMGLLLLISLPAILLFRRKKTKRVPGSSLPTPPQLSLSDRVKPIVYQVNPKNWKIRLPKFYKPIKTKTAARPQKKSIPAVRVASSSSKNNTKSALLKSTSQKKASSNKVKVPRRATHHNNNDVKLMGEEEHVCPYCLEEVVKNDSRGVAICPECHTWHHQDCWDITGGCGVAHRNEL